MLIPCPEESSRPSDVRDRRRARAPGRLGRGVATASLDAGAGAGAWRGGGEPCPDLVVWADHAAHVAVAMSEASRPGLVRRRPRGCARSAGKRRAWARAGSTRGESTCRSFAAAVYRGCPDPGMRTGSSGALRRTGDCAGRGWRRAGPRTSPPATGSASARRGRRSGRLSSPQARRTASSILGRRACRRGPGRSHPGPSLRSRST
jgi:hypothetical protein